MLDFGLAESLLMDIVAPVVDELVKVDPELPPVMIVGATCRDALHLAAEHTSVLRGTTDLDIALAVAGWAPFDSLTAKLERAQSSSGIRFLVAGVPVDLVPFGDVESPDGVVTPSRRGEPMSVFGFRDVWDSAYDITLPTGHVVRLPSIPGYTVLKLQAWADRSPNGQYKDGADLACPMYWYQNSREISEELYENDRGQAILIAAELDKDLAAVRLLIDDARRLLAPARRTELRETWEAIDDAVLAAYLSNAALAEWPGRNHPRLTEYAESVRTMLNQDTDD